MRLPRFLPLFMTAAGTIPPAKVLVLGAGVAGLQAIATAKRLGAQVSAYDVRAASADEVKSMGGTFVDLGLEVAEGTDPSDTRKATKAQQEAAAVAEAREDKGLPPVNSFEAVAREWVAHIHQAKVSPGHAARTRRCDGDLRHRGVRDRGVRDRRGVCRRRVRRSWCSTIVRTSIRW